MLDDSSNRLIWIAVGLALIFGMFETYNGTIPKILESVTSTAQASIPVEHTAYAYSADGTDRFSTVYPNLNLFSNSSGSTDFSGVGIGSYSHSVVNGTNKIVTTTTNKSGPYIWKSNVSDNAVGVIYTVSFDVKIDSGALTTNFVENADMILYREVALDDGWVRRIMTYRNTKTDGALVFYTEVASVFYIRKIKFEQGSTATPWIPSASEVQDSDYPTYVGTYTDHNQSDSNDPTKYSWKKR